MVSFCTGLMFATQLYLVSVQVSSTLKHHSFGVALTKINGSIHYNLLSFYNHRATTFAW